MTTHTKNPLAQVPHRKSLWGRIWNARYRYLLILPGVAVLILFSYVPMYGIQLAFKKYVLTKGITGSPWVGFDNFQKVFALPDFWSAFRNTIIISFGKIITFFPFPIILAILLNELRSTKFKRLAQTVLYMPHFVSWIVIYGLIINLFSVTNGLYGNLARSFGIQSPTLILGNPDYFRPMVFLSSIWKGAGWGTIIYLAALTGIDPALFEAARIDGAGRWKQIWYITLPSLSFAITVNLILDMGGLMNAGFDQIFNLYNASVYSVGDIIETYVYRMGVTKGKYEMSTAVGLFSSIINCCLLLMANKAAKLMGQEGLY